MRFTTTLTLAAGCLLLGACGGDHPTEVSTPAVAELPATTEQPEAADTTVVNYPATRLDVCGERMKGFLRWYLVLDDIEKTRPADSYIHFKYPVTAETDSAFAASLEPEDRSSTKYIETNWLSVDRYLEFLRKSGYFSQSFLQEKRASIQRRSKALDAAKMEDGEPEGFEADDIFWMMELYQPTDVKTLRVYQPQGAKLPGTAYELPLSGFRTNDQFSFLLFTKPENGRCVIDSIGHLQATGYESTRR